VHYVAYDVLNSGYAEAVREFHHIAPHSYTHAYVTDGKQQNDINTLKTEPPAAVIDESEHAEAGGYAECLTLQREHVCMQTARGTRPPARPVQQHR